MTRLDLLEARAPALIADIDALAIITQRNLNISEAKAWATLRDYCARAAIEAVFNCERRAA